MVKIRLKRGGTKKRPFYRIVVADAREKRDGKNLEIVGIYHPLNKGDNRVQFRVDRVIDWYKNGARATDTVYQLMKKHGIVKQIRENSPVEVTADSSVIGSAVSSSGTQDLEKPSSTTSGELETGAMEN